MSGKTLIPSCSIEEKIAIRIKNLFSLEPVSNGFNCTQQVGDIIFAELGIELDQYSR